ncbi:hypothetical protein GD606_14970 [Desulfolutivibrio sulfodismutans DSM 3696]|nr:hypothetical protein GD606_14970 [Desulfolutivibrio sulfodismutans DSM 3696]
MLLALGVAILALAGLTGLFILRRAWAASPGTSHYTFFPILFSLWIVSVVMWNTYFWSYKIPGLFDLSVERVLFVLLGVAAFTQILFKTVNIHGDRRIEFVMIVFLIICIVSMLINGFTSLYQHAPKPWYIFFTGYFTPFLAFFYVKYFFQDDRSIKILLGTLFSLGILLCIIAIMERFHLDALIYPSYITDKTILLHLDRSRGPLLNAAFNGLAMTICFVAGLMLRPMVSPGRRFLILILLPLFFVGVFFTSTRSAYLVFLLALGTVLFFLRSRGERWKLTPLILTLCLVAVAANTERLFSSSRERGGIAQMEEVDIRFQLIAKSLRLIREHPVLGVGLAHFSVSDSPETYQDNQHNHLIGMAVELGVIGVSVYLCLLILIFRRLYALARNPRVDRDAWANTIILLTLGITAALVNNVFVEASLCPFINVATFTFAGLASRLLEHPETLDAVI